MNALKNAKSSYVQNVIESIILTLHSQAGVDMSQILNVEQLIRIPGRSIILSCKKMGLLSRSKIDDTVIILYLDTTSEV